MAWSFDRWGCDCGERECDCLDSLLPDPDGDWVMFQDAEGAVNFAILSERERHKAEMAEFAGEVLERASRSDVSHSAYADIADFCARRGIAPASAGGKEVINAND